LNRNRRDGQGSIATGCNADQIVARRERENPVAPGAIGRGSYDLSSVRPAYGHSDALDRVIILRIAHAAGHPAAGALSIRDGA
jgi:hypothetical protein